LRPRLSYGRVTIDCFGKAISQTEDGKEKKQREATKREGGDGRDDNGNICFNRTITERSSWLAMSIDYVHAYA